MISYTDLSGISNWKTIEMRNSVVGTCYVNIIRVARHTKKIKIESCKTHGHYVTT